MSSLSDAHDNYIAPSADERGEDVQDWQIAEQLQDMPHRRSCPYGRKGPGFICTCPDVEPCDPDCPQRVDPLRLCLCRTAGPQGE